MDFTPGIDKLVLDHLVFTALAAGALPAGAFAADAAPATSDTHILYDSGSGMLSYDNDGAGLAPAVAFATLESHPALSAADFAII